MIVIPFRMRVSSVPTIIMYELIEDFVWIVYSQFYQMNYLKQYRISMAI